MKAGEHEKNNPAFAGQLAGPAFFHGEFHRYKVYPVHTRFESVSWFVSDAETIDELTGLPAIIRQESTLTEAIHGIS